MGAHSLRLGWVSLRLDLGPEGPLLVPAPRMPSLFKSWPRRQRVGSRLLAPIFHIMRLRYIVTKLLPQGYAVSQWQSWDRVPKSLAPEPTSRPVRSHCPAKGRQKHGAPTALGSLGAPEVRDRGAQGPEAPREHIASSGALPPPAYPVPTERDTDGRTPGPLGPAPEALRCPSLFHFNFS